MGILIAYKLKNQRRYVAKSGFISVIGRTNSGKSSLINYLLDTKIAMVSHKQNATRRTLKAIVMYEGNQLIFTDTPGLNNSQKLLNKVLNERALERVNDCDALIFCASVFDDVKDYEGFLEILKASKCAKPHIVVLSKLDLAKQELLFAKLNEYNKYSKDYAALVPMSVKKPAFKNELLKECVKVLNEGPLYYDEQDLSDAKAKDIYRDFILEAIFECVSDELPYSAEVLIKSVQSSQKLTKIEAQIITDNESHKGIFISALKNIGIKARKLIAQLDGNKIYLGLEVKVQKNWHKNKKDMDKILF